MFDDQDLGMQMQKCASAVFLAFSLGSGPVSCDPTQEALGAKIKISPMKISMANSVDLFFVHKSNMNVKIMHKRLFFCVMFGEVVERGQVVFPDVSPSLFFVYVHALQRVFQRLR